jgi:ferredoxin
MERSTRLLQVAEMQRIAELGDTTMRKIVSVSVEDIVCASHWACTIPDSRVFVEAENHFPVITEDATSHFDDRRKEIIEAVLSCPTSALSLKFEDGKVITSEDWEQAGGIEKWVRY